MRFSRFNCLASRVSLGLGRAASQFSALKTSNMSATMFLYCNKCHWLR